MSITCPQKIYPGTTRVTVYCNLKGHMDPIKYIFINDNLMKPLFFMISHFLFCIKKLMKKIVLFCLFYLPVLSSVNAQISVYNGGSLFGNGFARVISGARYFYIDTAGKYAFDRYDDQNTYSTEKLPRGSRKVIKGNKYGIITDSGRWILPAVYDKIEKYDSVSYLVYKQGKADLYKNSDKRFLFNFLFQDIMLLKDGYFAVKQNDKWGVYLKFEKKFVVPALYNEINYCFGCDEKSDYIYARKANKWGIISLKNEILLPFVYEHAHYNMRSDEWVTSFSRNDKQLVINIYTKKETIYPEECDCEDNFDWGFKRIRKNDKYGLVNTQGKLILDTVYNSIDRFAGYHKDTANPYIIIRKDDLFGVADSTGKIIAAPVYTTWPHIYNNHLFALEKDGVSGILNESGKIVMPFKLAYIENIFGDSLVLGKEAEDASIMLYRFDGTPLLKDSFLSITEIVPDSTTRKSAPLFSIKKDDYKQGFYNAGTGAFVAPQYDWNSFNTYYDNDKRLIEVRKDTAYGLLDENGVTVIPVEYNILYNPLKSYSYLVRALKGEKEVLFNIRTGKEVLSVNGYISQLEADSSLLLVQEMTNDGNRTRDKIVSVTGETVIPAKAELRNVGKGFAIQLNNDNGEVSLVNYKKRRVTPLPYKNVWTFSNDTSLIVVAKDTTTAMLLNVRTGRLLPVEYDIRREDRYDEARVVPEIIQLTNNYFILTQKGKKGIIDRDGNSIMPGIYDNITQLNDHIVLLQKSVTYVSNSITFKKMQYGIGDTLGRVIVPVQYDLPVNYTSADLCKWGYFLLAKHIPDRQGNYYPLNEKWGVADTAGNIVFEPKYDNVVIDEGGNGFMVQLDSKWGVLDKKGKEIVPCKYDDVAYMVNGYYRNDLPLSTPAMVKKGETFRYVNESGKELPVTVKQIIPYYPSFNEERTVPPATKSGNKKNNLKSPRKMEDMILAPPLEAGPRRY